MKFLFLISTYFFIYSFLSAQSLEERIIEIEGKNRKYLMHCGGFLNTPNTVISAKHCFENKEFTLKNYSLYHLVNGEKVKLAINYINTNYEYNKDVVEIVLKKNVYENLAHIPKINKSFFYSLENMNNLGQYKVKLLKQPWRKRVSNVIEVFEYTKNIYHSKNEIQLMVNEKYDPNFVYTINLDIKHDTLFLEEIFEHTFFRLAQGDSGYPVFLYDEEDKVIGYLGPFYYFAHIDITRGLFGGEKINLSFNGVQL